MSQEYGIRANLRLVIQGPGPGAGAVQRSDSACKSHPDASVHFLLAFSLTCLSLSFSFKQTAVSLHRLFTAK